MLYYVLLFLILLWFLGFIQVPLFSIPAFTMGGNPITLNDILVFFVIVWLISILPYPFRHIAAVLLLLWVLSSIGVIAIAGFPSIVLLAIIFGTIAFISRIGHTHE